jgi:hypothetical protein
VADLDLGSVVAARLAIDPVGHHNRPDVFQLHVDTAPRRAVVDAPDGRSPGLTRARRSRIEPLPACPQS